MALPALGFASPLLVLPAITSTYGALGFAAVAVGQATGTAFSVPVELGWALTGPRDAATGSPDVRQRLVCLSLGSRLIVFVPVGLAAAVVSSTSVDQFSVIAALSAVAFTANSLSLNWYFIGVGRPAGLFVADALPRLLGAGVSTVILRLGAPLWCYPIASLVATAIGLAIGCRWAGIPRQRWNDLSVRDYLRSIRTQAPNTVGRGFSAIYVSLPILVVSWVAPTAAPLYAAVDRMVRLSGAVLGAIPNSLQSWMGAGHAAHDLGRRAQTAVVTNAALGLASGVALAVAGTAAAEYLYSGTLTPTHLMLVLGAGIVAATCISRATGSLALVHLNRVAWVNWSAIVAAVMSLPLVAVGASIWGAGGALAAVLAAELTVVTVQFAGLLRVRAASRLLV